MSLNMEELCENLQSDERRTKLSALNLLQDHCKKESYTKLHGVFDEIYLHLLKCYSDRFESVREKAVQTVTEFVNKLPPNDFHLMNIISTLVERMGQQETLESSEEIRLLYIQQLSMLIQKYAVTGNKRSLQECYTEIISVLTKALRDTYPAVQRESCACVVALMNAADTIAIQPFIEKLTKPLYGMLNHKHSLARISAVEAIGRLSLHVDPKNDTLSQLIMEVSPLLMDSMPLVRRECGQLGILLALELRDRYSFFDRIIPFILCCLKDDSHEVVDFIRPQWIKCGKQYFDENEEELSKQEIGDLPVKNYPPGTERPTIGCRAIVQRSLRLLSLITRESNDWKVNVRLHSLKLLYQFVLHAEAAMTAKFFEIYGDVARACRDPETVVSTQAMKVADLMGRLFSYDDWIEHGFEGLVKNTKEGYLKCFYHMFAASLGTKFDDIIRVSEMLINSEFSQTLKPEVQLYVLKLVETILSKSDDVGEQFENDKNENLVLNSYVATIKVMALSFDSEQTNVVQLQDLGQHILTKLAERQKITVAALHENYFISALNYVENLDASLDDLTEPIILLNGLINIAKLRATYLQNLQEKIILVWENCDDSAKVKIFTSISVVMLQWTETINRQLCESIEFLTNFVTSVIEQHLLWHAGANAEAMRSMATATLCAMSQGAVEEARVVLPACVGKYLPSLLEDRSVATRHYSVKCLFNFGEVDVEQLKPIAYATLQRLDDPSAGIRELAAMVIPKLSPKFNKSKDEKESFEHEIWETFIKKALDMMFLHYEGPEVRLQKSIKVSINLLAEKYPEICKESYKRTVAMSYNSLSLRELQSELPLLI
ncbi:PREDICTED: dynein assembly factor 5, axonemal [Bactrocera latifrons]|uniref:HEAT repeat-containing protein 2 n=1 Tax=Bactrocera latifrons TaxID=174628 RepID=A0A0K8V088_BACLA|nr:PREDICTED: dynein assembly factor 5, axonemal [Bactrocera latifrons]